MIETEFAEFEIDHKPPTKSTHCGHKTTSEQDNTNLIVTMSRIQTHNKHLI